MYITSGLIEARLGLNTGEGSDKSSFDEEGVKGSHASCESGLEGAEEVNIGEGDLHGDRAESDEGVDKGGNGKLKVTSVNVTTSSDTSRTVFSWVDGTFNARRR